MGWLNIPSAREFTERLRDSVRKQKQICHCGALADSFVVITGPDLGAIRNGYYCHECSWTELGDDDPCKKCGHLQ
jgi:hypothetical protein